MTSQAAHEAASKLGLSAWIARAAAVGEASEIVEMKCVGFASADFALAEAETWTEAIDQATRLIFSA